MENKPPEPVAPVAPVGLDGLLSAVASDLTANLGSLKGGVKKHGGRFTKVDLARFAQHAPGVRVALLGVEKAERMNSGALWVYPRLGCSVFAHGQGRLAQVLTLCNTALMRITPNRWALNWAHVPQNVRCDNLYDAALDKTGVSIWAISWTQRIELQPQQVLEAFTTLSATWALAEAGRWNPAGLRVR